MHARALCVAKGRTADRIQIGATLKRMRIDAEVTREAAAEKVGCTIATIGNIEQGRTKITFAEWESHTRGQKLGVFDLPAGTL